MLARGQNDLGLTDTPLGFAQGEMGSTTDG
jgi:hypothetical protein